MKHAKHRRILLALTEPNRPLTTLAMVLACFVIALMMFAALVIGAIWISSKIPLLRPF